MKKAKKKQKKNWLSCHALGKFELSLNENQGLSCHALEKFELSLNENQESRVKKNVEKMMKKTA